MPAYLGEVDVREAFGAGGREEGIDEGEGELAGLDGPPDVVGHDPGTAPEPEATGPG
jgi:hypothetical protein